MPQYRQLDAIALYLAWYIYTLNWIQSSNGNSLGHQNMFDSPSFLLPMLILVQPDIRLSWFPNGR